MPDRPAVPPGPADEKCCDLYPDCMHVVEGAEATQGGCGVTGPQEKPTALDRIEAARDVGGRVLITTEEREALVAVARAAQEASFAIWESSDEERAAADRLREALARLDKSADGALRRRDSHGVAMTGPAVPSGLEALLAEATPGPWERGDIWSVCGVMPERFGEGKCIHCVNRGTEPEWVGRTDINGTVMLAHRHRVSNPYDTDHIISGADGATVCGNYDYEIGGVLRGEDARLIALAPDAVRLLIDMAASLDYGYFDRTTDTWRCAMCDAPAGHAEGCSHGEMLARFAALDQRAGTA